MSEILTRKLRAVRGKHTAVAVGVGAAQAVVLVVAWLAVTMMLDRFFELPYPLRVMGLAGLLVSLAYVIVKKTILPIVYGPDDEELALRVEHARPEFGTRLIASVQLSRPGAVEAGASQSLVRAMVAQTEDIAEPIAFGDVIKTDFLLKWAAIAAVVTLAAVSAYVVGGHRTEALLKRAFLFNVPLPTRTTVTDITEVTRVARGDSVRIAGKAEGHVPEHGEVKIRYVSGRELVYRLDKQKEDATQFAAVIDAVQETFDYRIWLYDGRSDWKRIAVLPRPSITAIEVVQVYPAYTGAGEETRPVNDLSVLVGSKLKVKVTANKPLRSGANARGEFCAVRRFGEKEGATADIAMKISSADKKQLSAEVELPEGTNAFTVNLVDEDDLTSKDAAVYRIDLVSDRPPTVHITSPDRKEILVTRVSKVDIGFIAEDDYGIAQMTLKYKVDDGDARSVPLNIVKGHRGLKNHFIWDVSAVSVPEIDGKPTKASLEGSAIEFWLEAEDANVLSGNGPGRGLSDKYMVRVVTKAEKQAELMARLGESLGNIRDVSENQEKANAELGAMITSGTNGAATQPQK